MEYGDRAASYVLGKIEKSANKGKLDISEAVEGFFKATDKASGAVKRGALKHIIGSSISNEKQEDIEDKITKYSQDPAAIVDEFVKNNEQLMDVAPKTAMHLQQRMLSGAQFLNSKIPRVDPTPFDDGEPSRAEVLKFKNYVEAVENPYSVIQNMKTGYITPEAVEAMEAVYPKMLQSIKDEFAARIPEFKGKIGERQKRDLTRFLGLNSRPAFSPEGFAQLQQVSAKGVQRDLMQQQSSGKVPVSGAKELKQSGRFQSALDKTVNRQ